MTESEKIEPLIKDLPDAEGARRFFGRLAEAHPHEAKRLQKKDGLLSDVLAIVSFSPLLAATLLQNPAYFAWLERRRKETQIRGKEDLLESLARFALTNSEIEPQILLARFRRRELLRIYLRDIRRLGTISETTGEISHLADAVLEYALRLARQQLDNRYGIPLEIDEKGRAKPAKFCIVSLGKLGSNELNYSSDVDLLFLYSADGATSAQGTRGAVTNREYFVKLAEFVTKIVGGQAGEGAAYRVDLRLRPHGRVGALAVSLKEVVNYYRKTAQAWERQTLIRARVSAGDANIFKDFFSQIETSVYSSCETVENALQNVKLSKDKINLEHASNKGFNVKLGAGGIREIEFIAQALQLAYGGRDVWLRAAHTLISLSRLADRRLLSETELTELFDAYDFLRRLEHRLQMENGLQTHVVPEEPERRRLVAGRMNFQDTAAFDAALKFHASNVNRIFARVFDGAERKKDFETTESFAAGNPEENRTRQTKPEDVRASVSGAEISSEDFGKNRPNRVFERILDSFKKTGAEISSDEKRIESLRRFVEISPYFGEMLAASPHLIAALPLEDEEFTAENYSDRLLRAVSDAANFRDELAALRVEWTKFFLEIAAFDVFGKIDLSQSKRFQTELAEAALEAALFITEKEIHRRYKTSRELSLASYESRFAVLGLGKLGGRGMDYGSDLDLILVYDDEKSLPENFTHAEFYARAAEIFVTVLSSFTREGNLYRVDLRLRPDGRNGATAIGENAFLNYLETRSAIWEWLAYVKLRGAAGEAERAAKVEREARAIVHRKASATDKNELKDETRRVRERLEMEKTRGAKNINIKFGAGGLLDIYFAARFLQLRDAVPDDGENRSTQTTLEKLFENKSLREEEFSAFAAGHRFLNLLDHNLRLTVGRSNSLPLADKAALQTIASRMNLASTEDLFEKLALHRLEIRAAYENIFS